MHYRTRYLDNGVRRFLAEDPLLVTGGLNFYAYVGNSPLNFSDPWGLTAIDVDIDGGIITVDPENGEDPYEIPITSGSEPFFGPDDGWSGCVNNSGCSSIPWTGPVPPGTYTIDPNELTDPNTIDDMKRNFMGDWGDWRVPLVPDPETNTFGRDGFFLHGGMFRGSAGCIDVGGGLFGNDLTDRLRDDILNDPNGSVPVNVH